MSPVQLVPTHRLVLSSRDNLALRWEGHFPPSDTADIEVTDCDFTNAGFDAPRDEKPAIGEHVGWLILLLVLYGVAWLSIGFFLGLYIGRMS